MPDSGLRDLDAAAVTVSAWGRAFAMHEEVIRSGFALVASGGLVEYAGLPAVGQIVRPIRVTGASDKDPAMSRPLPLCGQVEEDVIEYRSYRARALADGVLSHEETGRIIVLADQLATRAGQLAETNAAVLACLAGRDGLRSDRFLRRIKAANGGAVIAFPPVTEPRSAA